MERRIKINVFCLMFCCTDESERLLILWMWPDDCVRMYKFQFNIYLWHLVQYLPLSLSGTVLQPKFVS